ncbi:MAG: hypothetical protein M1546_04275 [Chloroflexi bacterium]|nr:hypothetical protein [Chloroflexota bacterium]
MCHRKFKFIRPRAHAPNPFRLPTDLAFDAQGTVYIADAHNARIHPAQNMQPPPVIPTRRGTAELAAGQATQNMQPPPVIPTAP